MDDRLQFGKVEGCWLRVERGATASVGWPLQGGGTGGALVRARCARLRLVEAFGVKTTDGGGAPSLPEPKEMGLVND